VIVEFEEGDPDRPIITGRVYNGIQKNPYNPKDKPNITAIRTNTVKGTGFNELRFDDTAGKEEIFVHAQYNMETRVLNDAKRIIKNDHHEIIEKEERREIEAERHETVEHDVYITHKDNQYLDISQNFLIKTGADTVLTANGAIHLNSSSKAVIEASQGITLKCGPSFVTVDNSGVYIKGPMVQINTGGSALTGPGTTPDKAKIPNEAVDQSGGKKDPMHNKVAAALKIAAASRKPFCEVCNA
jgi:type VI secretion system secreted protein VgrG